MVTEHTPVFSPLARDGAARAQLVEAVLATSLSEVEVDALEGCDPAVEHLIEGAKARGRPSLIEAVHVSPVVEIEYDFAAFRRRHREKWREIERRRRKLEREHTADFAPIARPAAVLEELDAALAVEGSGWKGELGTAISSSPQTLLFYRRVAEAFDATGELRLSTLVVDGRLAAFDLALLYRNRYFLLKTGYDESLRTLGPGLSLRLAVVETLLRAGPGRARVPGGRHGLQAHVRQRRAPPRGLSRLSSQAGPRCSLPLPAGSPAAPAQHLCPDQGANTARGPAAVVSAPSPWPRLRRSR